VSSGANTALHRAWTWFRGEDVCVHAALLEVVHPEHAVLIRYDEKGYSQEIERIVRARVGSTEILDYRTLGPQPTCFHLRSMPRRCDRPCQADDLPVRPTALSREGAVIVAHTKADRHYPLDEEIAPVLPPRIAVTLAFSRTQRSLDRRSGALHIEQLLRTDADESRRRYLIASASPKHQRLLSLVEHREFDRVQILAPVGTRQGYSGAPRRDGSNTPGR